MRLHTPILAALCVLACAAGAARAAAGAPVESAAPPPVSEPPSPSRLEAVTLYPGVARMQRVANLPANAREAVFACLPVRIDADSVQAQASPGVQVGEITLTRQPRAALEAACESPREARLRDLRARIAALDAQDAGLGYALDYLGSFGKAGQAASASSASAAVIAQTADALRQRGQSATLERLRVVRERERLVAERDTLLAGRAPSGTNADSDTAQVSVARVTLTAPPQGGQLRLIYQVRGPGWQPGYRAELDTGARQLRLTRLALVRQDTGEDWSEVALTLSTGRPNAATQAPLPPPWRVDIAPPPEELTRARGVALATPPPLPAPAAPPAPASADDSDNYIVAATDERYATTFVVPQRVSVPSGGGQIALALGDLTHPVALLTRTAPAQDAAAYLVATFDPSGGAPASPTGQAGSSPSADAAAPAIPGLTGVWPPGPVRLYRDGAYVGSDRLDVDDLARLGLSFGRDERVTVRVPTPERQQSESGFLSGRDQRRLTRVYEIENRHTDAITLQVLDAAPVAENDRIDIRSRYQPEPRSTHWLDQPGQVLWQQSLAAGATQRFSAEHLIAWPKDAQLRGQ